MKPITRTEIDSIRDRQRAIVDDVRALNLEVGKLLNRYEHAAQPEPPRLAPPIQVELHQIIPPFAPTPIPPIVPTQEPLRPITAEPSRPIIQAPIEPEASVVEERDDDSFEMQVGTVWLVRVGMIILLTGLVFLGNYAYQTWVTPMGPAGKLSMLMLAAGGLFGLGARLEKKREELVNYARVLMAGGIAAAYYTIYAAHFVERLRVIESPVLGGTLLLALGGGIVWFANRKRSEPVALLAVLLSYYTSAINPVGTFTLFSSFILACVAVYFVWRNGWAKLSSAALFATYASYGYWRFVQGGALTPVWTGALFLAGYWALFTSAVFTTRSLPVAVRATFATLNNGAFFTYASISVALNSPEQYWAFSVAVGCVLFALGAVVRWREKDSRVLDGTYFAQGAIIATAGLIMKLTGPQMAVLLAVESIILARLPASRHRGLLDLATLASAIGSVFFAVIALAGPHALAVSLIVIAAHIFSAWDAKRRECLANPPLFSTTGSHRISLAAVLGVSAIYKLVPMQNQPSVLAIFGVVSIASIYLLRIAELPIAGTGLVICAVGVLTLHPFEAVPAIIVALAGLGMAAWWKHQTKLGVEPEAKIGGEFVGAAVAVVPAILWMRHSQTDYQQIGVLLAVAFAITGIALRSAGVFLVGQVAIVPALISFGNGLLGEGHWLPPLSVPAGFAVLGLLTRYFGKKSDFRFDWSDLTRVQFIAALSTTALWAMIYLPAEWRPVFFGNVGAALLIASRWTPRLHLAGAITAGFALVLLLLPTPAAQAWLTIVCIVIASEIVRIDSDRRVAALAITAAIAFSAWQIVTRLTIESHREYLTVAWATFAFIILVLGIVRRERIYRRTGLATIALCVASVFLVDVWRLGTFERITAFLVLGGVLIALGFFYNRFRSFIAKWM